MALFLQPQYILLAATLLLVLMSVFSRRHTINIHLRDSYYSIGQPVFIMASVLIILAILYFMCGPLLGSPVLTWLHVGTTIAAMFAVKVIAVLQASPKPVQYVMYTGSWVVVILLVTAFAQFAFLLNLVLGFIKFLQK